MRDFRKPVEFHTDSARCLDGMIASRGQVILMPHILFMRMGYCLVRGMCAAFERSSLSEPLGKHSQHLQLIPGGPSFPLNIKDSKGREY